MPFAEDGLGHLRLRAADQDAPVDRFYWDAVGELPVEGAVLGFKNALHVGNVPLGQLVHGEGYAHLITLADIAHVDVEAYADVRRRHAGRLDDATPVPLQLSQDAIEFIQIKLIEA